MLFFKGGFLFWNFQLYSSLIGFFIYFWNMEGEKERGKVKKDFIFMNFIGKLVFNIVFFILF